MSYNPYASQAQAYLSQQSMQPPQYPVQSSTVPGMYQPHLATQNVFTHDGSYSTTGSYYDLEDGAFEADDVLADATRRTSPVSDPGLLSSDSGGADAQGRPSQTKRGSGESSVKDQTGGKKKPRITLARGGACVACRGRKLKCTGETPCKTCLKANLECKYEEIQRKKPRAVMLEERVAELEALLAQRPTSSTTSGSAHTSSSGSVPALRHTGTSSSLGVSSTRQTSGGSEEPSRSFKSPTTLSPRMPDSLALSLSPIDRKVTANMPSVSIPPHSPLELALIVVVLPHTPFLSVPLHPQRFIASLRLPVDHPDRPHPALLYVLFAEAVRILEKGTPDPATPSSPPYHSSTRPDAATILPHVQGSSLELLARARTELQAGISAVDRPFDLLRAATVIARYLYGLGRFIEGWNLPVMRLVVMCGLHRLSNTIVSGLGIANHSTADDPFLPPPNAPPSQYSHAHRPKMLYDEHELPTLRMRAVIIPPSRDWIELMERKQAFWAAKALDWAAAIGWGWTGSLADSECTCAWPMAWSETDPSNSNVDVASIFDLYNPSMTSSPVRTESTYTLAIKSMALLSRASGLFDLAIPTSTLPLDQRGPNPHPFTIAALQSLDSAMSHFQQSISPLYRDDPMSGYNGFDDPWWIMLHANIYTTQMFISAEHAIYAPSLYPIAVGSARSLAALMRRVPKRGWIHLDLIIAIDMSLVARFLFKEASRLIQIGNDGLAMTINEEATSLQQSLKNDLSPWMPMAGLHSMIVERVRDGWPEKEGEYERV